MHKVREINRMRELLSRAVNIASDLSNNKAILEAKNHIKKAIIELQNAENIQQNKKGTTCGDTGATNPHSQLRQSVNSS